MMKKSEGNNNTPSAKKRNEDSDTSTELKYPNKRSSPAYSAKILFTTTNNDKSATRQPAVSTAVMVRKENLPAPVPPVEEKELGSTPTHSSQVAVSTPTQTPKRTAKIENFS